MQNAESQKVTERFFKALEVLKQEKVIRGLNTFCRIYNVNSRNLYQLKKDPSRDMLKLAWLSYLITDFNISAEWLLTGRGRILKK